MPKFDPVKLERSMAARAVNQQLLARFAEVSHATISRACTGKKITPGTMRRIVRALATLPVVEGAEELLQ